MKQSIKTKNAANSKRRNFLVQTKLRLKILSAMMLCLIISPLISKAQDEEDNTPIKVDTLLFTIPLTVSNQKGNYITGLKKDDFTIYEDGLAQKIELFLNEEAPMNVAILLDTSYSTKKVLGKIQKAARDFVKVLRPEDKALIVSFDSRTIFLTKLESDHRILTEAIDKVSISNVNGSDMYDAVERVSQNYFAALKGRKAVIVLTDGMVSGQGKNSAQQTLDQLQKDDTFFYPIIFKTEDSAAVEKKRPVTVELLEIMAQETGGTFYEKDSAKLKEAFESIAGELKKQYLIGFYPRNTETGNSRSRIRVALDRDDLTVKTRRNLVIKN